MKQHIIYSNYDEELGLTEVIAENKYGRFSAQAVCFEEDFNVQNRWDGFRLCEYKIYLQTLKAKYRKLMDRADGMFQMFERFDFESNIFNDEQLTKIFDYMYKQVRTARNEAYKVKDQYEAMKKNYPMYCETILKERREMRNKIEKPAIL